MLKRAERAETVFDNFVTWSTVQVSHEVEAASVVFKFRVI